MLTKTQLLVGLFILLSIVNAAVAVGLLIVFKEDQDSGLQMFAVAMLIINILLVIIAIIYLTVTFATPDYAAQQAANHEAKLQAIRDKSKLNEKIVNDAVKAANDKSEKLNETGREAAERQAVAIRASNLAINTEREALAADIVKKREENAAELEKERATRTIEASKFKARARELEELEEGIEKQAKAFKKATKEAKRQGELDAAKQGRQGSIGSGYQNVYTPSQSYPSQSYQSNLGKSFAPLRAREDRRVPQPYPLPLPNSLSGSNLSAFGGISP
jgi:hypothetical protein